MNSRKTLSIGPRTHKDILDGKKIRKLQDEGDVFEDYWTDSGSESSYSMHSDISPKKKTCKTGKKRVLSFSEKKCETTQTKNRFEIPVHDSPSKNTRFSKQSLNSIMNSNLQMKSPHNIVVEDGPSKNARLSQQPEMNFNTQTESPCKIVSYCSLTNDTNLGKKSITSQIVKEKRDFVKTPNKDLAIYQKTDLRSTTDDVMLNSLNSLSKTKILDPKSSNLSDAARVRVLGKEAPVLEKVNVSSEVTDADMLAEGTARTETILQPNNDTNSTFQFDFARKLSLIPREAAEFLLKVKERKSIRVTRSYKPVNFEESLKQYDEYDEKIMQMIKEGTKLNSSHNSSVKESTVEINQTSSGIGKNHKTSIKKKKSLARVPSSHKKTDLDNKGYISNQVVQSDSSSSKENFELLNDKQSEDEISGTHQDENPINFNQTKTYSTHEMSSIDTAENIFLEQNKKEGDRQIVGSNEKPDSLNDNCKLISETFIAENKRKSVAYTQRKIEKNRKNNSKYKSNIKKSQSRVNEMIKVTDGCEIVNLKSQSEKNLNKRSPKKRKLIADKDSNAVESVPSDLIEHDLNDDNVQNKEPSVLEHELEDNVDVSVSENIGINVSNKYSKNDNISEANQLSSTDAILSDYSLAANVSETHDFDSSMPKVTKKQNHQERKIVKNVDHADKQHSNKRKDQSRNPDVRSIQKATKSQKLTKSKTKQETYNLKQNEQQKEQSENYIRRSTRTKYRPLASWKNERLLYGFKKDGAIEIFGLDPGSKASDHIADGLEKKNYFKVSTSRKKSTKITKPKKAKIVDPVLQKEMKVDVHKKFDLIPWHVPTDGANNKEPDYAYRIKKCIETSTNSFGFIEIAVGKEKPPQYIPEEDITLTVFRGKVESVIQENSYILCTKDTIVVPRGSAYCLKNIGSVSALISFVVGRFRITDSS